MTEPDLGDMTKRYSMLVDEASHCSSSCTTPTNIRKHISTHQGLELMWNTEREREQVKQLEENGVRFFLLPHSTSKQIG